MNIDRRPSTPSAGRKRDIHLIKLESVLLTAAIGGYRLVVIQDIVDELRPLGLGQAPRPFDKAHRTESKKCLPGFEIPSLRFPMNTQYSKAASLSQISILLRRQVQVGIMDLLKISAPSG